MLPYDLSYYKLTLPVNKDGGLSGRAHEITPPAAVSPYFIPLPEKDSIAFLCPAIGATTRTASNPRTELKDLRLKSFESSFSDKLKFRVGLCPVDSKVIVHQIHDDNEPWIKLVWHQKRFGGLLYALVKQSDGYKDLRVPLLSDVRNEQSVVSYLAYDPNGTLLIKANRVLTRTPMHRVGKGGLAYFKRGCYTQIKESGLFATVLHLKQ